MSQRGGCHQNCPSGCGPEARLRVPSVAQGRDVTAHLKDEALARKGSLIFSLNFRAFQHPAFPTVPAFPKVTTVNGILIKHEDETCKMILVSKYC